MRCVTQTLKSAKQLHVLSDHQLNPAFDSLIKLLGRGCVPLALYVIIVSRVWEACSWIPDLVHIMQQLRALRADVYAPLEEDGSRPLPGSWGSPTTSAQVWTILRLWVVPCERRESDSTKMHATINE